MVTLEWNFLAAGAVCTSPKVTTLPPRSRTSSTPLCTCLRRNACVNARAPSPTTDILSLKLDGRERETQGTKEEADRLQADARECTLLLERCVCTAER